MCALCSTPDKTKTLCFNDFVAQFLPPDVFSCKRAKSGADTQTDAAANTLPASADAKPAPAWVPCESFTPTQCGAEHKHECALCTLPSGAELCFSPTVAQALPPYVFECAMPEAPGSEE